MKETSEGGHTHQYVKTAVDLGHRFYQGGMHPVQPTKELPSATICEGR